jgi:hypothetical protein
MTYQHWLMIGTIIVLGLLLASCGGINPNDLRRYW